MIDNSNNNTNQYQDLSMPQQWNSSRIWARQSVTFPATTEKFSVYCSVSLWWSNVLTQCFFARLILHWLPGPIAIPATFLTFLTPGDLDDRGYFKIKNNNNSNSYGNVYGAVINSSWHCNCNKSSPGSSDEWSTAPGGCRPLDQANQLEPQICLNWQL